MGQLQRVQDLRRPVARVQVEQPRRPRVARVGRDRPRQPQAQVVFGQQGQPRPRPYPRLVPAHPQQLRRREGRDSRAARDGDEPFPPHPPLDLGPLLPAARIGPAYRRPHRLPRAVQQHQRVHLPREANPFDRRPRDPRRGQCPAHGATQRRPPLLGRALGPAGPRRGQRVGLRRLAGDRPGPVDQQRLQAGGAGVDAEIVAVSHQLSTLSSPVAGACAGPGYPR